MRQELEAMWLAHSGELKSFLSRRIASPAAVDDILQDVFFKTLVKLESAGLVGHFRGWLFAVARNAIVDYYRASRPVAELPETLEAPGHDPSAISPRAPAGTCLMPMINPLPEKMRAPLVMADLEGVRQREVARRLGISLPAVKSRILRARQKVRCMIEDCCQLELDAQGSIMDYAIKPGGISRWGTVIGRIGSER
jgi:RNA polymerase sigma factor, sigma-70 family